jgi:hypothetical protein
MSYHRYSAAEMPYFSSQQLKFKQCKVIGVELKTRMQQN